MELGFELGTFWSVVQHLTLKLVLVAGLRRAGSRWTWTGTLCPNDSRRKKSPEESLSFEESTLQWSGVTRCEGTACTVCAEFLSDWLTGNEKAFPVCHIPRSWSDGTFERLSFITLRTECGLSLAVREHSEWSRCSSRSCALGQRGHVRIAAQT